jgi:hypothetical protein
VHEKIICVNAIAFSLDKQRSDCRRNQKWRKIALPPSSDGAHIL